MVNRSLLLLIACSVGYVSCAAPVPIVPHTTRYFQETIWQERFDYIREIREQNEGQTLQQLIHDEKLRHMLAQQTASMYVGGWQLAKSLKFSLLPTDLITKLVDTELPIMVDAISVKFQVSNKQILEQNIHFEHMLAGMMLTLKYIHLLKSYSELGMHTTIDPRQMHTHEITIANAFLSALQTNQSTLTLHELDEHLDNSWHALCALDPFLYVYAERKRQLYLQHMSSCNVL